MAKDKDTKMEPFDAATTQAEGGQKFDVEVRETVIRTATYKVEIMKEAVVNDIPLSPDQEDEWLTYVPTYLPGHWAEHTGGAPGKTLTEEIRETEFLSYTLKGSTKEEEKTTSRSKGGTATTTGGGAVQGARSSDDLKGKK